MHPVIQFNLDSPVPVIAFPFDSSIGMIFNPCLYASLRTWERDTILNAAIYKARGLVSPTGRRATDQPVAKVIDLDVAREVRLCRSALDTALSKHGTTGTP